MFVIAPNTRAASPAAGPLTLSFEPLKEPITIPPIIPDIKPLKNGAPDAKANAYIHQSEQIPSNHSTDVVSPPPDKLS